MQNGNVQFSVQYRDWYFNKGNMGRRRLAGSYFVNEIFEILEDATVELNKAMKWFNQHGEEHVFNGKHKSEQKRRLIRCG